MAKRHIVELIDDLDQTTIDGTGGTHTFSFDGVAYEIDLSDANAEKLRGALEPFINAGRRAGRASSAKTVSAPRGRVRTQEETNAIRDWARKNGFEVSDRGRIAESIVAAYREA